MLVLAYNECCFDLISTPHWIDFKKNIFLGKGKKRMKQIEEKSKFCLSSALKKFLHDFLCKLIPTLHFALYLCSLFFLTVFCIQSEERNKPRKRKERINSMLHKYTDTKFNEMESNTTEGKDFKNKVRIYFELC